MRDVARACRRARGLTLDRIATRLPRRAVPYGGCYRAPRELLAAAFACTSLRTVAGAGRRQGRRFHGRRRRASLRGGARRAESRIAGLAVTRDGYGRATRVVRVIEAGHPLPDAAG